MKQFTITLVPSNMDIHLAELEDYLLVLYKDEDYLTQQNILDIILPTAAAYYRHI